MASPITQQDSRAGAGWLDDEKPLVVSMAAPRNCGKTVYLAALRRMAEWGHHVVRGQGFGISPLTGYGTNEASKRRATEHVADVYRKVEQGEPSVATPEWHSYHLTVERRLNGPSDRRHVYILDGKGGELFPGLDRAFEVEGPEERPMLKDRLTQLGLTEAEHTLMVFVNEPSFTSTWGTHHSVPRALTEYLTDVEFDNVVLYVACADVIFPRRGDLREALVELNSDVESNSALRKYLQHFKNSPHCAFTLDFMQYLEDAGRTRSSDHHDGGRTAVFWGSSFGIEGDTGLPNVAFRHDENARPQALLKNSDRWLPAEVLEPLLWSAQLLPSQHRSHV